MKVNSELISNLLMIFGYLIVIHYTTSLPIWVIILSIIISTRLIFKTYKIIRGKNET